MIWSKWTVAAPYHVPYAAPMRRRLINEASLRIGADYVALGTNLDDYAQSILMNVFRGGTSRGWQGSGPTAP